MGAWGYGPFDNDDAGDWVWELEKTTDFSVVQTALDSIVSADGEYLEAPDCSLAIAAAEVVAASLGKPVDKLPDDVRRWLGGRGATQPDLVSLAKQAVASIKVSSELRELWEESDHLDEWVGGTTRAERTL